MKTKTTYRQHVTITCDPDKRQEAYDSIPVEEKWDTHNVGPVKGGKYQIKASRELNNPSPFSLLMDQVSAMKKRSDLYFAESMEDEDFGEAEKHLRVSSVLKELSRLGDNFKESS